MFYNIFFSNLSNFIQTLFWVQSERHEGEIFSKNTAYFPTNNIKSSFVMTEQHVIN